MIDHVVVDVEIQKTIEETPGGWNATNELGVAVACVWQYRDQRMRVYGPDDVPALRERLLQADRISGYNIFNFDFPLIWGFSREQWKVSPGTIKVELRHITDDMLRRIWQAMGLDPDNYQSKTHGTCTLNAIAEATLGCVKIGNGTDAPKWYQAGYVQRVVNYCCDDVALERDLTDFVERYGYVVQDGKKLKIAPWQGGA